jgi:methyl-accepting chemotaxis protein
MKELNSDLSVLKTTQWILLGLGILLSVLITWLTSRSIVKPIRYAIKIAKSIAGGGRDLKIQVEGSDETADLLTALRYMDNSIFEAEAGLKKSELKIKETFEDLQIRIKRYRDYIALVSQGDLTQKLDISGSDDLSQLGEHLNAMTDGLTEITSQIIMASNDISSGLKELESSATSQAASASEQAASVTEVTSVVEEIKSTTKQTLEKATGLGQSAERTSAEAGRGKESLNGMIDSMRNLQVKIEQVADTILGLSEKSQQIGNITEAVSDIAKQSKMLALNASIEAAKAGEAGKGFAVVAGEVKELAEKSQASTENVKLILQDIRQATESAVMAIEDGTKGVNSTLDLAKEAGGIVNALGGVINESAVSSKQIVSAVRQESISIDQVVKSVGEIDKVTRQFSVATEQTKQASSNLSEVANALIKTVSIYKLSKKK